MKLSDAEKTLALVTIASVNLTGGQVAIPLVEFAPYFDRPTRLRKAAEGLVIKQLAKTSAGFQYLCVDAAKLLDSLLVKKPAELFSLPNRAPVPSMKASGTVPARPRAASLNEPAHAGSDPKNRPKPDKPSGFHENHVSCLMPHAHQNLHEPILETLQVHAHVHEHDSCNNLGSPKLHGHEVGELSKRTTAELLADIKTLQPKISAEHFEQWQKRIEYESADSVNAVIRQAKLDRARIKNMGGWMNTAYLKLVGAKSKARIEP